MLLIMKLKAGRSGINTYKYTATIGYVSSRLEICFVGGSGSSFGRCTVLVRTVVRRITCHVPVRCVVCSYFVHFLLLSCSPIVVPVRRLSSQNKNFQIRLSSENGVNGCLPGARSFFAGMLRHHMHPRRSIHSVCLSTHPVCLTYVS